MLTFEPKRPERQTWSKTRDLYYVCIAFSTSYETIWRFPKLLLVYGSPVLVAYTVLLLLLVYHLVYMEFTLGQYYSRSPPKVFKLCPLLEGIGISMIIWSILSSMFFTYLTANGLYVMNVIFFKKSYNMELFQYDKNDKAKIPYLRSVYKSNYMFCYCILVSWLCVFIGVSRKIAVNCQFKLSLTYMPLYLLTSSIITNFFWVINLNGFILEKICDWKQYFQIGLWFGALEHILSQFGIGSGLLITLGSYNDFFFRKHKANVFPLVFLTFICNLLSSILFTISIEHLSRISNTNVTEFKGLLQDKNGAIRAIDIQIMYFDLMNALNYFPDYCLIIFNIMNVVVGTVAASILAEVTISSMFELRLARWKLAGAYCSFVGLTAVLFIQNLDLKIIDMLDEIHGYSLVFIELFSLVAVMYCYRIVNFCADIRFMTGKRLSLICKIIWFTSPLMFFAIIISYESVNNSSKLHLHKRIATFFILLPVFIKAIINIAYCKGINRILRKISSIGPDNQVVREIRIDYENMDTKTSLLRMIYAFCCCCKRSQRLISNQESRD